MKAARPAPVLAIILPCFNEEDTLPHTLSVLSPLVSRLEKEGLAKDGSFILIADDGSTDRTWDVAQRLAASDKRIRGISLAGNRGLQNVIYASLMEVGGICDAAVTIDADLQDDPEAIPAMLREYAGGAEIVYGVRNDRSSDSRFKRSTAAAFYRFQKSLGTGTVSNHADFRLMGSEAIAMLAEYNERNLYLRGLIPSFRLPSACVEYNRTKRMHGKSKYDLPRMLSLGIDGITSLSARPMRWIFFTGLGMMVPTVMVGIYILATYFTGNATSPGWTSIMLSVWFLGSLLLMGLGIVGEYIGKIFNEVKQRPRYHISRKF